MLDFDDGAQVGTVLGSADGSDVGKLLGSDDGLDVGTVLGSDDGSDVGTALDLPDGIISSLHSFLALSITNTYTNTQKKHIDFY